MTPHESGRLGVHDGAHPAPHEDDRRPRETDARTHAAASWTGRNDRRAARTDAPDETMRRRIDCSPDRRAGSGADARHR